MRSGIEKKVREIVTMATFRSLRNSGCRTLPDGEREHCHPERKLRDPVEVTLKLAQRESLYFAGDDEILLTLGACQSRSQMPEFLQ
jgi:hypothetical protein